MSYIHSIGPRCQSTSPLEFPKSLSNVRKITFLTYFRIVGLENPRVESFNLAAAGREIQSL